MELKRSLYTASATTSGGRAGHVQSSDGVLDLDLAMPKEMGGDGGSGTNPEQLFAAGYSACFENALRMIASNEEVELSGTEITANVEIGPVSGGGFGLAVELIGRIPGASHEQARSLMERAHESCPYSKAIAGNIDVSLVVAE